MLFLLSDFTIITHEFPNREDIHIYAVGDLHLGSAEHMRKEWDAFLKRILEDPHGYVILVGDLINNSTRNSVGNGVFEDLLTPSEQVEVITEQLKPLSERILASVSGNHCDRTMKDCGFNVSYDIAVRLGIQHLWRDNIAFVRIRMGDKDAKGTKNPTYMLTVVHGNGGGKKTGSAVNNAVDFANIIEGNDCLVPGHTHKPYVTQGSKLFIDTRNNQVSFKPYKVVSVTSWLQYGGYAAKKMLPPTGHSPQIITLCGTRKEMLVSM